MATVWSLTSAGSASGVGGKLGSPRVAASVMPLPRVAVAAEDDLAVRCVARCMTTAGPPRATVPAPSGSRGPRPARRGLGDDRVEHRVGPADRLARADGAELELVAGEGERAGPVAVAGVARQGRQDRRAESEIVPRRRLAGLRRLLDLLDDVLELSPRKIEMIAGGASLAPGGGRWPALAIEARSRSPCGDGVDHRGAEEEELEVLVRRVARAPAGCCPVVVPSTSCCACPSR